MRAGGGAASALPPTEGAPSGGFALACPRVGRGPCPAVSQLLPAASGPGGLSYRRTTPVWVPPGSFSTNTSPRPPTCCREQPGRHWGMAVTPSSLKSSVPFGSLRGAASGRPPPRPAPVGTSEPVFGLLLQISC